ncbi:hypothetical protein DCM90_06105 [Levilactobacillus bambusae]|uniref:NAD(P)-binding domain-containing protein n=1 Tax=Levilactobacillus bambusae TaxID=2024736 RepID=A0A2V1N2P0_9LACO|nr:hypothetical protein DCM90_06105 [Levilactobacillus bambusae]
MTQTVLVLGATGGTGQAIVHELLMRDVKVRVFGRNRQRLESLWPNVETVMGDIFNLADLIRAMQAVDVVIQCAAIPYSQTAIK